MKRGLMKLIPFSLVCAMVVFMFVGCSSPAGTTSTTTKGDAAGTTTAGTTAPAETTAVDNQSKEIVFWNIATEEPNKSLFQYAVDKFNSSTQSGYTVTSVATQNDTYKEKLVVAMSSGVAPDMFTNWSGGPMNEYIDAGFGQPVTDLAAEFGITEKLMDAAVAQGTYKGELYGIAMNNVSLAGVYYNKEMFDKYGLKVPKTVSELEAICDTLIENDITPFALANASKWTGSMYFMSLATRFKGLEPFQAAADGTGSFEDDSYVYAGTKIQEWVNKGYFPEGVNSLSEDDGQAKQLMYQETAAMMLIGSWQSGTFKTDSEEFYNKIGWFSFPAVDDSTADATIQIGTIGDQFITFSCTDNKLKAAVEMVSYYFDDESIQMIVDAGKIPPIKTAPDLITDPVTKDILNAATGASAVQLWYDQYLPPAVAEVHKDTCQEIFGLTMTPQEANAALQAAMQEYLDSKK